MNKRPGLDPFLEALARDYNTIVFTAAMPDYAGPVLDYIDPKGTLFHRRLYRSSCRQVGLITLRTAATYSSGNSSILCCSYCRVVRRVKSKRRSMRRKYDFEHRNYFFVHKIPYTFFNFVR